jgi:NNP family nitrate/nitrite transporter-like MFS transporter
MKLSQLALFWGMWYLAFSTRSLISPFLPLIEAEFALNHATAGGLLFFVAAGSTLALALTGHLSLRFGYKRLIIWSFGLAAMALVGLSWAHTYLGFACFLFLFGIGGGFYLPCAVPILTTVFERRHWGKAIAIHETAAGFCLLSIPFLVAMGLGVMPWRRLFLVLAGLFLLLVTLFWVTGSDTKPERRRGFGLSTLLVRGDFWIIMALWLASGTSAMGVYNIVPLFLVDEKQLSVAAAGKLLSLSRVGGFLGQISMGFFLDRFRTRSILTFLSLTSGLAALGLAFAGPYWLLAVMLVLQGTFCVTFFPAGIVAISKLTRPEERSLYTGAIMAVSGVVSLGLAPGLLGAIADHFSFQVGLLVIGGATLLACPLLLLLRDI